MARSLGCRNSRPLSRLKRESYSPMKRWEKPWFSLRYRRSRLAGDPDAGAGSLEDRFSPATNRVNGTSGRSRSRRFGGGPVDGGRRPDASRGRKFLLTEVNFFLPPPPLAEIINPWAPIAETFT